MLNNILFLIVALFVGGLANMMIIQLGTIIIPPPGGVDVANIESIKKHISNYPAQQFLFPFLAHAIGTMIASAIVSYTAKENKLIFAMLTGVLFMAGGVAMVIMLPAPLWFEIFDLVFAYIPMSLIGYWLVTRNKQSS